MTAADRIRYNLNETAEMGADIVLLIDKSGSVAGKPLSSAAEGTVKFIERLMGSREGEKDITQDIRMALVSFSGEISVDVPLTYDREKLILAAEKLTADGYTYHEGAFREAKRILDMSLRRHRIILMFTDGDSTIGVADRAAGDIRKSGTEIFCIGFTGSPQLDEWASAPAKSHVLRADNADMLVNKFLDAACLAADSIAETNG